MLAKSEHVYTELRQRILAGEFSPGYRLVLARLANEHDMSPVPVREALRRLEAEGLVRFTRNVGAEVVGVDENDYSDTMRVLAGLEGMATAMSAPRLELEDLLRARMINSEMRRLRDDMDPLRFTALNQQFHDVLCSGCPNVHLLDLLGRERDRMSHLRRSTFSFVPERSHTSVDEHDHLIDMMIRHEEPVQIELFAREHKLRTLERFLEVKHARENRESVV